MLSLSELVCSESICRNVMLDLQDGITSLHDTVTANFTGMAKSDELAKLGIYLQLKDTA